MCNFLTLSSVRCKTRNFELALERFKKIRTIYVSSIIFSHIQFLSFIVSLQNSSGKRKSKFFKCQKREFDCTAVSKIHIYKYVDKFMVTGGAYRLLL